MKIKFTILEVQPDNRGMVVKYYTDEFPTGSRYFVTIYGDMLTGANLEDYIMSYAPVTWLVMKSDEASKGQSDMNHIVAMIGTEVQRSLDAKGNVIPIGPRMRASYNKANPQAIVPGAF